MCYVGRLFSSSALCYTSGMKIAEKILYCFIFLIPFAPFLVVAGMFFPFVAPKMLALEGLTLLAGIVWLYLWYTDPARFQPKITWLTLATAGYILVAFVAALQGVNFWRSFWSGYERMDGVFTWMSLFLLFFSLGALFKTRSQWLWIFRLSLGVSILIGLDVANFFGIFTGHFSLPTQTATVFGSPIFIAVYALFHVAIAMLLLHSFFEEDKDDLKRDEKKVFLTLQRPWVIFYVLGLALNIVVLFATFARGPILGFFVGVLAFCFFYASWGRERKVLLKTAGIVLGLMVLTFPLWRGSQLAERISSVSAGFRADETRIINWNIAFQAFQSRLFLGWGSNNYSVAQNKFYNPYLLTLTTNGFDRVHNKYLEIAVDTGILGLGTYLALFFLIFFALYKQRKREPFVAALLGGLLLGYLVQNITAFDNPGSYFPLFLIFALINNEFFPSVSFGISPSVNSGLRSPLKVQPKPKSWLVVGGWALFLALLWQGVWQPYEANKIFAQALLSSGKKGSPPYQKIMDDYKTALSYQTLGDYEIRTRLGAFLASQSNPPAAFLDFGISELEKAVAMSPHEVLLRILSGKLYEKRAMSAGAKEKEYLGKANAAFLAAIALSPSRIESHEHYIVFLVDHKEEAKAREETEKIRNLDTKIFEGQRIQTYIAFSYYMEGNFTKAHEVLHDILKRGGEFSSERDLLLFTRVTFELGKFDEMVHWYEELVKHYPTSAQYRVYLATAYKQVGNKARAIEFAHSAATFDSSIKGAVEDFIKSLQ